ncbi:transcriptional regulator [Deltaproteobacteria bacterium]|nr:transcriptional regulator [Deltaproteobacteria bacterium]
MQSLDRIMSILRTLALSRKDNLRLTEIASAIGLAKPTVDRLLEALCAEGLVERDETDKTYRLGMELMFLGLSSARVNPLGTLARPVIEELAAATGDGIFLGMRAGNDQVCTDRAFGDYPVKAEVFQIGGRRPLGVGANGLAILGCLPREEVAEICAANELRLREYANFSPEWIMEAADFVRDHGYIYTEGRIMPDVNAMSMPVRGFSGYPVAAVAIVCLASRFANGRFDFVRCQLRSCVTKLEAVLQNGRTKHAPGCFAHTAGEE